MKIFAKVYLEKNFGDDLFLDILTNRYRNTEFITMASKDYKKNKNDNLIVYNNKSLLNLFIKIITLKKKSLEDYLIIKSDATILIGGSIFIQKSENKFKKYGLGKKNYYIIGSNFGPYKTEDYYNDALDFFSRAKDVCFREKYSYDLFSKLDNIRYASDIVFSMDISSVKITNNKKVVISIIDCGKKIGNKYKDIYERKIIEMIQFFYQKNYSIVLISFCKKEGDEDAIESIISRITDESIKSSIQTYFYNGNISEALNIMGDSQIIVGSRFHANIIGLVLGKTIIPICYSTKTNHVLDDINFKGKRIELENIDKFDIKEIENDDLNYKLDISAQKIDAQRHFEKIDKLLWGK